MAGIAIVAPVVFTLALFAAPAAEPVPAAAAAPTFVSAYRVVAMMPLSSLGSTEEVATAIERVLLGEFKQLLGNRLVPPERLLDRGRAAGEAFMQCEGVVVCLVEVVGGLGWDAFVVGNIAGLGDDRVINIKLIDVRTGGEVRRAWAQASGDEAQLIVEMRKAAVTLMAPELLTGSVDLDCSRPSVQIMLDGQVIGTTPLERPRITVPVGKHAIEASGEGLVPFSTVVDVAYGEVVSVSVDLSDNTVFLGSGTPFRSRWWTWAMVGVGAIAAGMGGYFNYQQADVASRIEDRARQGTLTAEHRGLYGQESENWLLAQVLYGAGGGLLGGAAILLLIDLF